MSKKYSGKLIVFEGIDGCGKSTQLKLTSQWLQALNFPVLETKEPTEAFNIRELVNNNNYTDITELFLFLADRAEHVNTLLLPALEDGNIVLCDRYYPSTYAYQNCLPLDELKKLNDIATNGLQSDLIIWLHTTRNISQKRLARREFLDKYEIKEQVEIEQNYKNQYFEYEKITDKHGDRFLWTFSLL